MQYDDDLIRTAVLAAEGREGELHRRMRRGELERIRSGAYVSPSTWAQLQEEERIRMRARAAAARARREPVFVFTTAGAQWHVPVHGVRGDRVHVLQRGSRAHKSRGDIVRHSLPGAEDELVLRDGLVVTSLERTTFDIIRMASPETAVAFMDGALRQVAWRGHGEYDHDRAGEFREEVQSFIVDAGGAPGIRQARFVCAFADGRAQLPGESVRFTDIRPLCGARQPVVVVRAVSLSAWLTRSCARSSRLEER